MVKTIGAVITDQEESQIYRLVERGVFLNKSDFTRTAIRELLEKFPSIEEAKLRNEEKEAIETHLKDCEPCRELIASIKSDIDRNKLQEIVKTVNEKLQDDVEAKERMDALSKELSDIPYEDLKKKTTVKSDKLGADQDDGKHEADWDEERGKYR